MNPWWNRTALCSIEVVAQKSWANMISEKATVH